MLNQKFLEKYRQEFTALINVETIDKYLLKILQNKGTIATLELSNLNVKRQNWSIYLRNQMMSSSLKIWF